MAEDDKLTDELIIQSNHFFLSYCLKKEEEEYIATYNEISVFEHNEQYPGIMPELASHFAFGRRIFRSEVNIVLVAASMIEAMANMFYSEHADSEMFSIIQRATPIDKWVTLPRIYIPNYSLPKNEKIFCLLKSLISRRNSITHQKPNFVKGGAILHKGNVYSRTSNECKLHIDFCRLPGLLVQHLSKYDKVAGRSLELMFFTLVDDKTYRPK